MVLIGIEAFVTRRRGRRSYDMRDAAASLAMFAGEAMIVTALNGVDYAIFSVVYECRFAQIGFTFAGWLACFVAIDFVYYWFHRATHEVRVFWASHVPHRSSEEFNFTTALRQPWTAPFLTIYGFWTHTREIDPRGVLEGVLVTPSHHRVHHGANPEYLDRNYGNLLIVWDELFGTFAPERAAVRYGLTRNVHTSNPIRTAFDELVDMIRDVAQARRPGDALGYLLRPPGWQPAGHGLPARGEPAIEPRVAIKQ